jgi:hypothetical protein
MKKKIIEETELETINTLFKVMGSPTLYGMFGGLTKPVEEPSDYQKLGNGFELRPLDIENNRNKYSHLFKDGVQISKEVFRKGGTCSGFKDGYCSLIIYKKQKDKKKSSDGFDNGEHVIINESGEVKMGSDGCLDSPYHLGGNVASLKQTYYNLLTGKPIITKSSTTINAKNYLIVEHRYDFDCYKKIIDIPVGVYKLDKITCELEKIDDIK